MEYDSFIGNCRRRSLNGHLVCVEVVIMRGMYALIPLAFPFIISPSVTLPVSLVTIKLVPLQSSLDGSRFHRSITGTPIFSFRTWSGSPITDRVFKNSVGVQSFHSGKICSGVVYRI
jgi:hypothetical protein